MCLRVMQEYAATVNFKIDGFIEFFEKLTLSHLTFERIHPFKDGNGRVGRMILNQQLINNGLLPVALTKNSDYIQGFKQFSRNGDYSKLMYEILKGEEEAIDRLTAFEKKRAQGLNWDPKITLEGKIEAADKLRENQGNDSPARNDRDER